MNETTTFYIEMVSKIPYPENKRLDQWVKKIRMSNCVSTGIQNLKLFDRNALQHIIPNTVII